MDSGPGTTSCDSQPFRLVVQFETWGCGIAWVLWYFPGLLENDSAWRLPGLYLEMLRGLTTWYWRLNLGCFHGKHLTHELTGLCFICFYRWDLAHTWQYSKVYSWLELSESLLAVLRAPYRVPEIELGFATCSDTCTNLCTQSLWPPTCFTFLMKLVIIH